MNNAVANRMNRRRAIALIGGAGALAAAPATPSGGIANAASGAAGVASGAWTSIYGSNLAAATRTLASTDIVNNQLPTTLGGVGVQIDGKAAYPYFVSPSQINVLAPAGAASGSGSLPDQPHRSRGPRERRSTGRSRHSRAQHAVQRAAEDRSLAYASAAAYAARSLSQVTESSSGSTRVSPVTVMKLVSPVHRGSMCR